MSEQTYLTYAAQITISLPDSGESISLTVTLWPADAIDIDGHTKPLSECTLADLERYAEALEVGVWEAFEAINLPDLEAKEQVRIDIRLINEEDEQEIADWQGLNLLLPLDEADASLPPAGEEEAASRAETDETVEEETAPEAVEGEQDLAIAEISAGDEQWAEPAVEVAGEELVYPEIEQEVGDGVPISPIVPSQARVRVAGQRLPLNDPTWAAVDILMDEPALRAAQAHALSSLNREVAGVLVGRRPEKQPDGRYVVHVFDTIVARHTVMQGASVTYTPESWRYLNDTLAERYPDETAVMVGWYHTHPGFGIFLSGMDLFIHQNFFTQIWHVAMVLDPRARTSGFFCWDRQKTGVSRCDFGWPPWAAGSW